MVREPESMSDTERQNIEIKVRLSEADYRRIDENAARFAAGTGDRTADVDTYFRVPHGRLKLRVSNNADAGTLIYYERSNEAVSRLSHYRLIQIADAQALREALTAALGVLITVTKRRTVAIHGSTRIHFDTVEELGRFIELETVVGTQTHSAALAEHRYVFQKLGLDVGEIVPESYSDLLLEKIG